MAPIDDSDLDDLEDLLSDDDEFETNNEQFEETNDNELKKTVDLSPTTQQPPPTSRPKDTTHLPAPVEDNASDYGTDAEEGEEEQAGRGLQGIQKRWTEYLKSEWSMFIMNSRSSKVHQGEVFSSVLCNYQLWVLFFREAGTIAQNTLTKELGDTIKHAATSDEFKDQAEKEGFCKSLLPLDMKKRLSKTRVYRQTSRFIHNQLGTTASDSCQSEPMFQPDMQKLYEAAGIGPNGLKLKAFVLLIWSSPDGRRPFSWYVQSGLQR
jgi:hypothetical protein